MFDWNITINLDVSSLINNNIFQKVEIHNVNAHLHTTLREIN